MARRFIFVKASNALRTVCPIQNTWDNGVLMLRSFCYLPVCWRAAVEEAADRLLPPHKFCRRPSGHRSP
ncbi:MAG TPA: hypothetical protein VFN37_08095, partial [Candidatus Baltobacteraceae bacterium]|nr:hypothetical protein [Candidatus Baltobacteraceae bacterium]